MREIRQSLGRFFAIFAIIALGAGFFSGLRITSPVFVHSMDRYYNKANFFDYRILSGFGWDDQSVEDFKQMKDVKAAEGAWQTDVLINGKKDETFVYKVHSLTKDVNKVDLKSGKMPKKENECLIDASYHEGYKIGDTVTFSDDNEESTLKSFAGKEFKITGYADSPLYTNFERGTTSIGNGSVKGFIYVTKDAFKSDTYPEIYAKLNIDLKILSDDYDRKMDKIRGDWEETADKVAVDRADRLRKIAEKELADASAKLKALKAANQKQLAPQKQQLEQIKAGLDSASSQLAGEEQRLRDEEASLGSKGERLKTVLAEAQAALAKKDGPAYKAKSDEYRRLEAEYRNSQAAIESGWGNLRWKEQSIAAGYDEYNASLAKYSQFESQLKAKENAVQKVVNAAKKRIESIKTPQTWLLERNTNLAYACFESDSKIVGQVAGIFPLFFVLVAALVCGTTMTRMIEDKRGQIGILKGLGYSESDIMNGFLTYSDVAAIAGCVIGFAIGIFLFPAVIWHAYRIMYIDIPLRFTFDTLLFAEAMAAALACSLLTSWIACRKALSESAASLLRPRAPKIGKRILIENLTEFWDRLSFIHKVSIRNIFRYKARMLMMIIGIGGCMALLLTGFGLRDSISTFAKAQFDDIQIADAEITYSKGKGDQMPNDVINGVHKIGAKATPIIHESWDMLVGKKVKNIELIAPTGGDNINNYFVIRDMKDRGLSLPKEGEALISVSLAKRYDLKKGDTFTLRNDDMKKAKVKITGVFENYVYNYVFVSPDTIKKACGEANVNSMYLYFPHEMDMYQGQTVISKLDDVQGVVLYQDLKDRITNMMSALNYVVLLIIICAAGLAFIVVYNLTNINIIERLREIATVKVLGFFRRETAEYVFHENLVLTGAGIVLGVFLGIGLHRFVMARIVVDMVYFPVRIAIKSFLLAIVLTFVFTLLIDAFMSRRMDKINMAESLKAVE